MTDDTDGDATDRADPETAGDPGSATRADSNDRPTQPPAGSSTRGLSRRRALGALAAAGLATGWLARDRIPWPGAETTDGEPGDGDPESDPDAVWRAEAEIRDRHESNPLTLVPTLEYEPVRDQPIGGDGPIERASAVPAETVAGDRVSLVVESSFAETFVELVVELWADPDESIRVETTVDGRPIEFSVFSPDPIALGVALRSSRESDSVDELLVARAADVAAVEDLVETFEPFADGG